MDTNCIIGDLFGQNKFAKPVVHINASRCVFKMKAVDCNIGSLGGGGRYAELTEVFGEKGMSCVGISFGAERIYNLMLEKQLFPATLDQAL